MWRWFMCNLDKTMQCNNLPAPAPTMFHATKTKFLRFSCSAFGDTALHLFCFQLVCMRMRWEPWELNDSPRSFFFSTFLSYTQRIYHTYPIHAIAICFQHNSHSWEGKKKIDENVEKKRYEATTKKTENFASRIGFAICWPQPVILHNIFFFSNLFNSIDPGYIHVDRMHETAHINCYSKIKPTRWFTLNIQISLRTVTRMIGCKYILWVGCGSIYIVVAVQWKDSRYFEYFEYFEGTNEIKL